MYTHFDPAVKIKIERVDQIDSQFCPRVWVRDFKRPPLIAFKKITIYTQDMSN